MFALGIDPGLTRCGFGVVEGQLEGPESFRLVSAGVLETSPHDPVEARLAMLFGDLESLYRDFSPDVVVVEKVFYQKNAKTAVGVTQASGVAVAMAAHQGRLVRQFTAQQVKMAVSGYGAASKEQVQSMVARILALPTLPQPADAADALGLAITYFMTVRTEQRVSVAS
jgi:crossover junction endodeoxyribonuclease RuvC